MIRRVFAQSGRVGPLRLVRVNAVGTSFHADDLALQAAADASESFPDGVFWVPLAPLRDPALVLSSIARTLAVAEEPGTALEETLTAHLSGKTLLCLLDNVEHLLPDAAERYLSTSLFEGLTDD